MRPRDCSDGAAAADHAGGGRRRPYASSRKHVALRLLSAGAFALLVCAERSEEATIRSILSKASATRTGSSSVAGVDDIYRMSASMEARARDRFRKRMLDHGVGSVTEATDEIKGYMRQGSARRDASAQTALHWMRGERTRAAHSTISVRADSTFPRPRPDALLDTVLHDAAVEEDAPIKLTAQKLSAAEGFAQFGARAGRQGAPRAAVSPGVPTWVASAQAPSAHMRQQPHMKSDAVFDSPHTSSSSVSADAAETRTSRSTGATAGATSQAVGAGSALPHDTAAAAREKEEQAFLLTLPPAARAQIAASRERTVAGGSDQHGATGDVEQPEQAAARMAVTAAQHADAERQLVLMTSTPSHAAPRAGVMHEEELRGVEERVGSKAAVEVGRAAARRQGLEEQAPEVKEEEGKEDAKEEEEEEEEKEEAERSRKQAEEDAEKVGLVYMHDTSTPSP
jgi:hypothetical protein